MANLTRSKRAGANSGRGTRPILLGVAVAVGAIALIAVVVAGNSDSAQHSDLSAVVSVTGNPLPAFSGVEQAAGTAVPLASGSDFAGNPVEIAINGKPKLVLFLAHWCSHCQAEVPVVRDWLAQNEIPDSIELISVATAMDTTRSNFPPSAWLEREQWPAPVLVDDAGSSLYRAYGAGGFPFWAIVDADGKLITRVSGEGRVDLSAWVAALDGSA